MNRKYTISFCIFFVILAGTVTFGVTQWHQKNQYRLQVSNTHRRSLYQTVASLDDVEKLLSKAQLAKDPKQCAPIFADIWRQASSACDSLSTLPYQNETLATALRFLSQARETSYAMMNKAIDGKALENEDWKKVSILKKTSAVLANDFNAMCTEVGESSGILRENLQNEPTGGNTGAAFLSYMAAVNQTSDDDPAAVSGKPFARYQQNFSPFTTTESEEITMEEGAEVVKDFLKAFPITDILFTGTTDRIIAGGIPAYSYTVCLNDNSEPSVSIDISRENGFPVWMLDYTEYPLSENKLTPESAVWAAERFLTDRGHPGMKSHYYETYENSCTIHFVYEQDGWTFYPDMIKVKVSLTDGRILGYEATDYLTSHRDRPLEEPKLAEWQAAELVSPQFKVTKVNLAIISLANGEECLCYEFDGMFDDARFLVYINANNGKQEKILQWIESEHGALIG